MDVTKHDTLQRVIDTIENEHGRLDVLFCNAGFRYLRSLGQAPMEDIQKVFDTNVYGVMQTIKTALPLIRQAGYGHIVATWSYTLQIQPSSAV